MHPSCAPARTRAAPIELADVVRAHGEAFAGGRVLRPEERSALRAIERCRTAALGGHLDVCTACGLERPSYNSCRNRHCPKCQSLAQARWVATRLERILPVHYFHVVFTLPAELRAVARRSRARVFDMLFASAADTLATLARDPKWLGAELGVTMVLHTWTRALLFHPHVHAIVTGGGLTGDAARWVRARRRFLFPVRVMGVSMGERGVTFRTRDGKSVTVPAEELLARFVQHVLPRGFVKIRHYGLHSASHATTRLETARRRLGPHAAPAARPVRRADAADLLLRIAGIDLRRCPACHTPALVRTALPEPRARDPPGAA